MTDYRIDAATKEEWAEWAIAVEAKLAIAVEVLKKKLSIEEVIHNEKTEC